MKFGILLVTASLLLTGCGVKEEMSEKMDNTLDQIKKTNEIVKQQCVALTFEGLINPEFGSRFDIIPFAKKFGACTAADEIVEVLYLWTKKLADNSMDFDSPTPEQTAAYAKSKEHVFTALQAVSGLLSQDKIDYIVAKEINGDGRFQDTAYEILMLRTLFIHGVLLEGSLFTRDLNNVGKIQKAIEYANQIEKIERLSFARLSPSPIQFSTMGSGVLKPAPADYSFQPGTALSIWKSIRERANGCFAKRVPVKKDEPEPTEFCVTAEAAKAKLTPATKAQVSQALKYINSKIVGWGEKLEAISGLEALP